jgi:hypothetical protein
MEQKWLACGMHAKATREQPPCENRHPYSAPRAEPEKGEQEDGGEEKLLLAWLHTGKKRGLVWGERESLSEAKRQKGGERKRDGTQKREIVRSSKLKLSSHREAVGACHTLVVEVMRCGAELTLLNETLLPTQRGLTCSLMVLGVSWGFSYVCADMTLGEYGK